MKSLDSIKKELNIDNDYISIDDVLAIAKKAIDQAEKDYYSSLDENGKDTTEDVQSNIDRAIYVLKLAKDFDKQFGL